MEDLKLALSKFESLNSNLKEILNDFDSKKFISTQRELLVLKEKNKKLQTANTEAIKKINEIMIKIIFFIYLNLIELI